MGNHLETITNAKEVDFSGVGREVLKSRAFDLGPETGKGLDDLAVASIHDDAMPAKTLRAYQLGQRRFAEWCSDNAVPYAFPAHSVTPAALAWFVTDLSAQGLKPASVKNYVAGVVAMHRKLDLPSPADTQVVRDAMSAMCRTQGTDQKQAKPLRRADIDAAIRNMGDSLADMRNAALLSLAYDTGGRASDLCALNVGDLSVADGVASIRFKRGKTDQHGKGRSVAIMPDTLSLLEVWLDAGGQDREGPDAPLFIPLAAKSVGSRITRRDVARIFKAHTGKDVSAHSVRVGAAQDLRAAGFSNSDIAHALGWKSEAMPMRYTEHLSSHESATVKLAKMQGRA